MYAVSDYDFVIRLLPIFDMWFVMKFSDIFINLLIIVASYQRADDVQVHCVCFDNLI